MRLGDNKKVDSEYVRNGTCSIFAFVEPLGGCHHVSVRDIAEIELNVMTRQCMSRRIESIDILRNELSVWEVERNEMQAHVNWQFRTKDARIKLLSLYPEL